MIKNSTELLTASKEALLKMLLRCLERGTQPSYHEMYERGYANGYTDARDMQPEDMRTLDKWHWIETEGLPPTDDKCWCLIECDGYYDKELGNCDDGCWELDYNPPMGRVVAWHMLPDEPDWKEAHQLPKVSS